jgi:hypothetical protein
MGGHLIVTEVLHLSKPFRLTFNQIIAIILGLLKQHEGSVCVLTCSSLKIADLSCFTLEHFDTKTLKHKFKKLNL